MKPIYQDVNADKLATKYNANLVMTNSAFVHLIYNLSKQNDDELKMPAVVKSLRDSGKWSVTCGYFIFENNLNNNFKSG